MWKQLAELFTGVFTLTHRLDKLEQAVREQQREMKELTAADETRARGQKGRRPQRLVSIDKAMQGADSVNAH